MFFGFCLTSSIVLASASTRSFRLAMCALLYTFVGPRMGQVPLLHCRQELQSLFKMLLLMILFFPFLVF
ncbi:MAG: hypothetical protein QW594_01600 [Candidatus Woesearchaeota archaeon]